MKEKKQSPAWYIAATHWLTSGFLVPMLTNLFLVSIFRAFSGGLELLYIITILIPPFVFWLGVKYSASYINKRYVITNPREIAILSTVYLVVIIGGLKVYRIIGNLSTDGMISLGVFIVGVIVFFVSSKKYIKANI